MTEPGQLPARHCVGHPEAGADHVAIGVLGAPNQLLSTLAAMAGPLGSSYYDMEVA